MSFRKTLAISASALALALPIGFSPLMAQGTPPDEKDKTEEKSSKSFKGVINRNEQRQEFDNREDYEKALKDMRKGDWRGFKRGDKPAKKSSGKSFHGVITINGERREFNNREEYEKALKELGVKKARPDLRQLFDKLPRHPEGLKGWLKTRERLNDSLKLSEKQLKGLEQKLKGWLKKSFEDYQKNGGKADKETQKQLRESLKKIYKEQLESLRSEKDLGEDIRKSSKAILQRLDALRKRMRDLQRGDKILPSEQQQMLRERLERLKKRFGKSQAKNKTAKLY